MLASTDRRLSKPETTRVGGCAPSNARFQYEHTLIHPSADHAQNTLVHNSYTSSLSTPKIPSFWNENLESRLEFTNLPILLPYADRREVERLKEPDLIYARCHSSNQEPNGRTGNEPLRLGLELLHDVFAAYFSSYLCNSRLNTYSICTRALYTSVCADTVRFVYPRTPASPSIYSAASATTTPTRLATDDR